MQELPEARQGLHHMQLHGAGSIGLETKNGWRSAGGLPSFPSGTNIQLHPPLGPGLAEVSGRREDLKRQLCKFNLVGFPLVFLVSKSQQVRRQAYGH